MRASREGREKTALACIQCLYSRVERKKKIINAIKCGQINQMPQTLMKILQGENFLLHLMVSNLILAVKGLGIYLL